jgi:PadR family transcriptional regulator, regulatory protein PadR
MQHGSLEIRNTDSRQILQPSHLEPLEPSQLTCCLYICRLHGMELRLSQPTLQALEAFLQAPKDWKYGYDISRNTGLKSGTLYPILMRLAERKLLETSWETAEIGKPPRHLYRLTPEGMRFAREHRLLRSTRGLVRPAFSGVKS